MNELQTDTLIRPEKSAASGHLQLPEEWKEELRKFQANVTARPFLYPLGHVAELRHKQDDLALCDNCGTYIYLPPDEMVVSPMPPARRGRGRARTPLMHV